MKCLPGTRRRFAGGSLPNEGPRQLADVTAAWQQAQEAFEESERRYRNLVEHSLGLICTHDLDGRLLSINPAAAHSLGYEPEHGVGSNLVEFLAPDARHLFAGYLQRIREHGQDVGVMRVIARDGSARGVDVPQRPLRGARRDALRSRPRPRYHRACRRRANASGERAGAAPCARRARAACAGADRTRSSTRTNNCASRSPSANARKSSGSASSSSSETPWRSWARSPTRSRRS